MKHEFLALEPGTVPNRGRPDQQRAPRGVKPGSRPETRGPLPIIIHDLRRRGYRMVTVPRLLLDNPAPAKQNVYTLQGAGG